jgi:Tfp pilus assembly protein FimT
MRSPFRRVEPPLWKGTPAGLTLLEVVLAMAILFGSLAVLSQMAWTGSRAAVQGQLMTQAVLRCEAKLAEVASGAVPLQATSNTAFADDPQWTWSLVLGETAFPELMLVEVTVSHSSGYSSLGNVSHTMRRWLRDPAIYEVALEQAAQSQTTTLSSTSTLGSR